MTIFVFVGPTLAEADAREHLAATYLPPAAQGDVYRVARERPAAIGIIDGYFDTLPAVWHKEVLWAIHEGIPVFGSASMGALRAAELAAFGMRGVGAIFEAFRSGELEDDDEVALAHEPEAGGYRPLSVPMVNVRATLAAAVAAGVLGEDARDLLVARAKGLFYPERSYRRLLAEGNAAGLRGAMDRLAAWLPAGQVDAKRADAVAMLRAIRTYTEGPREDAPARFHFEHTTYWEDLRRSTDEAPAAAGAATTTASTWRDVLDELRLNGGDFERMRLRALNRAFARVLGGREGRRIDDERLARAAEDFRRRRGLLEAGSLDEWLLERGLDRSSLARLLEDEALMQWAWSPSDLQRRVVDELKLDDGYPAIRQRAAHKEAVLAKAGLSEPAPGDAGVDRDELVRWYFAEVAGTPVPTDLARHVSEAGYGDEQLFLRAALREHLYRRLAR